MLTHGFAGGSAPLSRRWLAGAPYLNDSLITHFIREVMSMRNEMAYRRSQSLSRRAAWLVAASALALTLALGGCRAGARTGGSQSTVQQTGASAGTTTGPSAGSSNSSSLQQLENIDNQNQSDSQQLNSAQNDAGVNYSGQENQTQP